MQQVTDELDKQIGRQIHRRRTTLGWTQGDLAKRLQQVGLNWSQGTLSKVENGERPVRLSETSSLTSVLGVEGLELMSPHDALSSAMLRLHVEIDRLSQVIREADEERSQLDLCQQALSMLLAAAQGKQISTSQTAESLLAIAFSGIQMHEAIEITEQLGVPRDAVAKHVPLDYDTSRSLRFAAPTPRFVRACAPLVAKVLPSLAFRRQPTISTATRTTAPTAAEIALETTQGTRQSIESRDSEEPNA
ncbi:helix-turn-helix domain-containing protein [Speluncibacter jeojiensis]|uniref:Helix-turn-helix domain-containing protein n=1 Tax=Speluncibacter jeojiensis TaxID=2710754 RepID=A0A9X4RD23_9ACTN|nr:helix-turn-helix domain-containing protein [Corynebacteriales bacterium D3-21]